MPSLGANFKKHWPVYAASGILFLVVIIITVLSVSANSGHLVYTLDDAYIHMALAKNLSLHGVWGVTKYGFTSSSSSLLWTSFIALIYFIFGLNEITPYILNLFSSFFIVISVYFIFRKNGVNPVVSFLFLAMMILIVPIVPLMFTGLEHVSHILVSILFVYFVSELISSIKKDRKRLIFILLLALCLPALRYEGLVLVFIAGAMLLYKKEWLFSVLIMFAGVLPIFVFGIISVSNGWSFFPNSLIMKAEIADVTSLSEFIRMLIYQLSRLITPSSTLMLALVLIGFLFSLYFYRKLKSRIPPIYKRNAVMVFLLLVNVVLYYFYAKTGWSYRYQSFLVAMAVMIIPLIFFGTHENKHSPGSIWNKKPAIVIGYIALMAGIIYQGIGAYRTTIVTPVSTTNIYQQQYQTAQFIKRFYEGKAIALNDIGTTSYFTDIKLVDMWGLADINISKLRRTGTYTKNDVRNAAKNANLKIAVIYDSWFAEGDSSIIPDEWKKAGEWRITDNIAASDSVVSIYAADSTEVNNLIENLRKNAPLMPAGVIQSGKYIMNLEKTGSK